MNKLAGGLPYKVSAVALEGKVNVTEPVSIRRKKTTNGNAPPKKPLESRSFFSYR